MNVNNGGVYGFYRKMDGNVWYVNGLTGQFEYPNGANADNVYYLTDDCTGPAYVDQFQSNFAVGNKLTLRVNSTNWLVTSTTALHTLGEPLSGFRRDVVTEEVYCENDGADYLGPTRRTLAAYMLTPLPAAPAPLAAPLTYDQ